MKANPVVTELRGIEAAADRIIAERDHLRERIQNIKNELSGINPADLTKAEKNILAILAKIT